MTAPSTEIILTSNQYGKAENRVVRVTRDTDRHEVADLNVTSQLRGDFAAAHIDGDNSHVVATDTQKNTIFAFAKDGISSPEEFLLRLAEHFTEQLRLGERRPLGRRPVRLDADQRPRPRLLPRLAGGPDRRARPRRRDRHACSRASTGSR